ncbi:hypothetical protein [Shinella sp. JR1-6]|uniref:hypothetical protein n=1 Tax=Shinella sp. JR1-6 TaxID=2527671 RepID=UPI00102D4EF3|nr:hypothetical protein [Shinella sp. JR1-6]TAA54801.1 hypothetical protein EXZ48_25875 [Shinella sp. JR1-6]
MKRTSSLVAALVLLTPAIAGAAMDINKMQTASGLAEIISRAEHCGYKVDEAALETYYEKSGLANPEALAFISGNIAMSEFAEKPSASTCTLARTTARSIGILAE